MQGWCLGLGTSDSGDTRPLALSSHRRPSRSQDYLPWRGRTTSLGLPCTFPLGNDRGSEGPGADGSCTNLTGPVCIALPKGPALLAQDFQSTGWGRWTHSSVSPSTCMAMANTVSPWAWLSPLPGQAESCSEQGATLDAPSQYSGTVIGREELWQ